MAKVIVYLDSSADITRFKELHHHCEFIFSSYDKGSRPQKDRKQVATPSSVQWRDWHTPWNLNDFSWDSMIGSENLDAIYAIIGKDPQERLDGLHLDSAYKSKAHLFLTEDIGNIVQHREKLERLLKFRIFDSSKEPHLIKEFIQVVRTAALQKDLS